MKEMIIIIQSLTMNVVQRGKHVFISGWQIKYMCGENLVAFQIKSHQSNHTHAFQIEID